MRAELGLEPQLFNGYGLLAGYSDGGVTYTLTLAATREFGFKAVEPGLDQEPTKIIRYTRLDFVTSKRHSFGKRRRVSLKIGVTGSCHRTLVDHVCIRSVVGIMINST